MKALALLAEGSVRVVDVPEPQREEGMLLLQVETVGLCGTDLNSFRGKNPLITYPRILGHEIAATVLEGTSQIPHGTRVTISPYTSCGECSSCLRGRSNACRKNQTLGVQRDGGLTELLVVSPEKVYPSLLSIRHLALVEPLTVGFHAVSRGRIERTDSVAIFGCGGVGLGAIAGAARRGARVIAIDVDEAKLATAKAAGATETINSQTQDTHTILQALTNGEGPDVVIEAIGLPSTFRAAVEEVAFTGRVVYIGYAKEPISYETKLFVQKELDVMGSRNALAEDFLAVIAMLEEEKFPVDLMISAEESFEKAPSILAQWSSTPAAFTKILINI
jgi:threonine dehydrogenase-like Zn-dependent dehydrogenase